MIAKGQQPVVVGQAFQRHIGVSIRAERKRFQRRGAVLINRRIGILRGVELINDVDRLRRHPELGHEGIKCDHLVLLLASLRNQVIKLNPEHDFAIGA